MSSEAGGVMEIEYSTTGYLCWTDCPCIYNGPMVASEACEKCKFFVSIDKEAQVVKCKGTLLEPEDGDA